MILEDTLVLVLELILSLYNQHCKQLSETMDDLQMCKFQIPKLFYQNAIAKKFGIQIQFWRGPKMGKMVLKCNPSLKYLSSIKICMGKETKEDNHHPLLTIIKKED